MQHTCARHAAWDPHISSMLRAERRVESEWAARGGAEGAVGASQGYLAHKKQPPPPRTIIRSQV